MTVATQNERLAALTAAGVSIWLDQIRRTLIEGGELQRLIDEDSLRGVTSNPSIFEKAILGSSDYDADLRAMAGEGLSAQEIYDRIAVTDVQLAADVLRPVWEATDHVDGYVSLEVSPYLARDSEGTLAEARAYWAKVDRPNVMIKIPGTVEGLPAIETAISEGINVNVTLLFAVDAYVEVAEAFIKGLEQRAGRGDSVDVHSVASFFVSRVDSAVDKQLESAGREDLLGTAAVANARAAYQRFRGIFHGERFARLAAAGAPVQRPLWASTGVKNPRYADTKYVDELVAPETVNTMPMNTLLAAAERSVMPDPAHPTADQDPTAALEALAGAGIDMTAITDQLLEEGIKSFEDAMTALIAGVDDKREAIVTNRPPTIGAQIPERYLGAIAEKVKAAVADGVAKRIWKKDDTLWGAAGAPEVGNRLGWLTVSEQMLENAADLHDFVAEVQADGLTDVALLGMGGSSLGPEVIRRTFGEIDGALRLHVLDSTDPGAVLALERSLDLSKTLFLVSSKSGGTVETLSHFRYFHERVSETLGWGDAGSHFVAITDPGGALTKLAAENNFRRVFENDPNIGGRYSVMSYFGLVPAALMGVSIEALLHRCQVAEQNCNHFDSGASNSGLWLGIVAGQLALEGRDKLTFVVSEPISSFGLWAEQLIAESTGKQGKGLVPVADEPLGAPDDYGDDRVFVYLRNVDEPDAELDAAIDALAAGDQPIATLAVHGPTDLGRIFFFAEFATAVAGWALGINPFDQPNVQEAKDNTAKVLDAYKSTGSLPEIDDADEAALQALLTTAAPPNYVAIMGFVAPSPRFDQAIVRLRAAIRARTRTATTFGYGPRYLHSTGQLHKGGPKTGRFLALVHDGDDDVEIPGAGYTFATLKNAQAAGDLETLRAHGLPAERVRLTGDPTEAVERLTKTIEEMA
jgi:transaldolase/glucose-6-phosphate isomerase